MATMETFVADKWVALEKGKDLFSKAADSGIPIRVVHPNGNFKVIRNGDKLPEAEPTTSTKPKAVEEKLEIIEKAMTIDPAMVGA